MPSATVTLGGIRIHIRFEPRRLTIGSSTSNSPVPPLVPVSSWTPRAVRASAECLPSDVGRSMLRFHGECIEHYCSLWHALDHDNKG
ncbi:hypothetical protein GY45DRAFT_1140615 [Cubamyces sp. BRFM 1775]|nr:hypothetical protein GY45DRAFT_1140615 [Cubamyces sp. BRFM 1775]